MKMHRVAVLVVAVCSLAGAMASSAGAEGGPAEPSAPSGEAVLHWNEVTADVTLASGITPLFDPLHESRAYAMVQIAVHDALNAIERRFEPYALDIGTWPNASPEAAVATAAHHVLVAVLPELPDAFEAGIGPALDQVEAAYGEAMADVPDGTAKRVGASVGAAAAAVVVALRADDGADAPFFDPDYVQRKYGTATPPAGIFRHVDGAPFAVAPLWGEVTPFVLSDGSQYRPDPPASTKSRRYAADFNEVKELGALEGSRRTDEQTEIALFWFESSPLRWNRIARTVSEAAGLDLWEAARGFALLDMALADGYIGNWDAKYHYDAWRTETAIRHADIDDNANTEADPGWTPLWGSSGATPEHDSGHAIEGAAAATVLAHVIGTDDVTFTVCSYTLPSGSCGEGSPTLRTYTSFSQAALENGESRIWVGWHFRLAVEYGLEHGHKIGSRAVEHFLEPVGA